MIKYLTWTTLVFLLFSACSGKPTYYKSGDELYRQRIPNSSVVIYKYVNYGEFAWSNWHCGQFIMDSNENVNEAKFIKDLLPFYYTKIDLDSNIIEAIEFIDSEKTCKKGTYEKSFNGITYKIKRYYYERGSGMNFFYIYHNLTETKDSIFFEKLTVGIFGINLPDNIGFRKGDIIVMEDSLGFVSKLTLKILNQCSFHKIMNEAKSDTIRLDDGIFTGEDQIYLSPLSLVYSFHITLIPDSLSQKQKISDYGVYKKVNR
jgi:hypothetical protein